MCLDHYSDFLNLTKIAIKIGPPIKAVKIPIGNSEGSTILLLKVSAVSNKILPHTADKGRIKA
jgi:hypothetical protein